MNFNRRQLIQTALAAGSTSVFWNDNAFGEDMPNAKGNHFCLNIHFSSHCGAANGLIQPLKAGSWAKGTFFNGKTDGCVNTNLNSHTQAGSLVFHDYLKFLTEISKDMCLVNGNPRSLAHETARMLQTRGVTSANLASEWVMGFGQNMVTDKRKNPLVLSSGGKTASAADITLLSAKSLAEFQTITRDATQVPSADASPIWDALRARFASVKLEAVVKDKNLGQTSDYQLNTLINGMPELAAMKADIDALTKALDNNVIGSVIDKGPDAVAARGFINANTRDSLILAGILAKSGLASGMSMGVATDGDLHTGGVDLHSPRLGAAVWAQIAAFWKWVRSVGLENDLMIIVTQEFARGPYNGSFSEGTFKDKNGADVAIKAYGRDHGVAMGTMFINAKVPSSGRIGNVVDNFTAVASKDAAGTAIPDSTAYLSENIVGSMFMRVFDDIFPTERMVRSHWPTFVQIQPILDAK